MIYFTSNFTSFLKELAKNNNKEWFDANRKTYESEVKKPFAKFVEDLIDEAQLIHPDIQITPREAILRINRDTRFSPDKTPYNTHVAAVISAKGRKDKSYPGYYIQLAADKVSVFGGAYMTGKVTLRNIREAIVQKPGDFSGAYNDKLFKEKFGKILGEQHKRIPKEFQDMSQKEPLIINKQFYFATDLDSDILLKENLTKHIATYFRAGKKVNNFLISAMYS